MLYMHSHTYAAYLLVLFLLRLTIQLWLSGVDPKLMQKILDPFYLDQISGTFDNLAETVRQHGPWASIWVGESGGAYNSGGRNVSDTFVNSFW